MNESSCRIDPLLGLFLQFEMLKNVGTDDILIKADSSFSGRMEISIRIHPRLQIWLELLAQLKVLLVRQAQMYEIPLAELACQMRGIPPCLQ
jgi:hypothetical protein